MKKLLYILITLFLGCAPPQTSMQITPPERPSFSTDEKQCKVCLFLGLCKEKPGLEDVKKK